MARIYKSIIVIVIVGAIFVLLHNTKTFLIPELFCENVFGDNSMAPEVVKELKIVVMSSIKPEKRIPWLIRERVFLKKLYTACQDKYSYITGLIIKYAPNGALTVTLAAQKPQVILDGTEIITAQDELIPAVWYTKEVQRSCRALALGASVQSNKFSRETLAAIRTWLQQVPEYFYNEYLFTWYDPITIIGTSYQDPSFLCSFTTETVLDYALYKSIKLVQERITSHQYASYAKKQVIPVGYCVDARYKNMLVVTGTKGGGEHGAFASSA